MSFRLRIASIATFVHLRDKPAALAPGRGPERPTSEFLALSPDIVRARLEALAKERRDVERADLGHLEPYVRDLEEEIVETKWLFTKLAVAELAIAQAEQQGRLHG
jgi:hypothetical protein